MKRIALGLTFGLLVGFAAIEAAHADAGSAAALNQMRFAKAKSDIQALETALTEYRLDNSTYPTTEEGLDALVRRPRDPSLIHWHGPYVNRLSKDPWGYAYHYVYPGTHGQPYDLYSFGPPSIIGNWNLGN
jgi:general secretion pathway protein G